MKNLFTIVLVFIAIHCYSQIPEGYYSTAEGLTGDALKAALHNIIDDHTTYSYTSSSTDVWDILKESDRDPGNSANVILLYTGWSVNAAQEYNNGSGWSREHVWAKSHGDFSTDPPAGTDAHHLRPADISVNSARSDKDFDNGGTQHSEATECYTDADSWEPRDAVKGDVARMMFYMATRYEGDVAGEPDLELVDYVTNYPDPIFGVLSTLLEWHSQDPVDEFERNRNDVVYSYQGNRNPFIDHPEYVSAIYNLENIAPEIANVSFSPESPTSEDDVIVSCEATDSDGSIASVVLRWKKGTDGYTDINMTLTGTKYYGQIPAQNEGETVNFIIIAEDNSGSQASYNGSYQVSESTGLANLNKSNIKIYPNPVSDILYINIPVNYSIEFYSIIGEKLMSAKESPVNVSNFDSGVYFVLIKSDTGKNIKSIKFLKK